MTDRSSDELQLVGTLVDGRYRVERVVSRGGQGIVYLALDEQLRRKVALKFLLLETLDERQRAEAGARFAKEAQFLARFRHPAIPAVHNIAVSGDGRSAMLVMEFVEGRSLSQIVKEESKQSWPKVFRWAEQAAGALSELHEAKIVHRDVKPANLLVDAQDRLKVLDFGIAHLTHDLAEAGIATTTLTGKDGAVGTPEFMAPEQLRGDDIDGRTDIYALGLVMFFLLAGDRPWAPKDGGRRDRVDVKKRVPDLPEPAAVVIRRATQLEAKRRWQTMSEMRGAMLACLQSEDALRGLVPDAPRLSSRIGTRWRGPLIALSLAVVAAAGVGGVYPKFHSEGGTSVPGAAVDAGSVVALPVAEIAEEAAVLDGGLSDATVGVARLGSSAKQKKKTAPARAVQPGLPADPFRHQ